MARQSAFGFIRPLVWWILKCGTWKLTAFTPLWFHSAYKAHCGCMTCAFCAVFSRASSLVLNQKCYLEPSYFPSSVPCCWYGSFYGCKNFCPAAFSRNFALLSCMVLLWASSSFFPFIFLATLVDSLTTPSTHEVWSIRNHRIEFLYKHEHVSIMLRFH